MGYLNHMDLTQWAISLVGFAICTNSYPNTIQLPLYALWTFVFFLCAVKWTRWLRCAPGIRVRGALKLFVGNVTPWMLKGPNGSHSAKRTYVPVFHKSLCSSTKLSTSTLVRQRSSWADANAGNQSWRWMWYIFFSFFPRIRKRMWIMPSVAVGGWQSGDRAPHVYGFPDTGHSLGY